MTGRRIPDHQDGVGFALAPGDYGRLSTTWLCCTPNGYQGNLGGHQVQEHADGTITVTPSIKIMVPDGEGGTREAWHGFLKGGVWTSC